MANSGLAGASSQAASFRWGNLGGNGTSATHGQPRAHMDVSLFCEDLAKIMHKLSGLSLELSSFLPLININVSSIMYNK